MAFPKKAGHQTEIDR